MLRQSLKALGGEALLEKAGIDPTARPEELRLNSSRHWRDRYTRGFCDLSRSSAERASRTGTRDALRAQRPR